MTDVLFIKTSSLGDVIHHWPAVTEAKVRRPGIRVSWVVEEAFAPLVRLHPAVDEVIAVTMRRWRGGALLRPATYAEIAGFCNRLRSRAYDLVIDTQGLLKSAIIARSARGERHGYDMESIREPHAARLYDVRHRVGRNLHAVARNRLLTAQALGYAVEGAPDYGLDRKRLAGEGGAAYGILLHATAQAGKQWPVESWRALIPGLPDACSLVVPWGDAVEQDRARQIAEGFQHVRVPGLSPLDEVARLVAGASFVIGVDTGLLHLAAALGVPLVAIFSGSDPSLTGPVGAGPIAVLGAKGAPPHVQDVVRAVRDVIA